MKKNISKLAKFKRIDPNVLEKYGVTDALLETGCHESIELGLFGEPAKIFFSQQNADFENVEINGEGGIYIVDGSLSVKGSLTFAAFDAYTFLVITGNLNVSADFIQKEDAQLLVLGKTQVGGTMWIDLSDAGFTVFRGEVSTKNWCQINTSVENSFISDLPISGEEIPKKGEVYDILYGTIIG